MRFHQKQRPLPPIKQPLSLLNVDCLTFVFFQFLFTSESVGEGHPGESFLIWPIFIFKKNLSFFSSIWPIFFKGVWPLAMEHSDNIADSTIDPLFVSRDLKRLNWGFCSFWYLSNLFSDSWLIRVRHAKYFLNDSRNLRRCNWDQNLCQRFFCLLTNGETQWMK